MERHFEAELAKLNSRILEMGNLVQLQIENTMKALVDCNVELAREIIENDNQVDLLDVKIDKLCQRIFALQQPVALDLRFIMSSLKINNDLERIGDLAVFIAKRIDQLVDYKDIIMELQLDEIANNALLLVKDSNNLLASRRLMFVKDIYESSVDIKRKARSVSANILEEMMHKSDVVVVATTLVLILYQIERIAGYSMNIAESVYFMVEGKIVKHSTEFLE